MSNKARKQYEETGKVFRDGKLVDEKDIHKMQTKGVEKLQHMGTSDQVAVLRDSLHQGRLSHKKLRQTLEGNARKEMRKGADKLRKKGKDVTVDVLLKEYREDKGFRELATSVGLDETWFAALAESACPKEVVCEQKR